MQVKSVLFGLLLILFLTSLATCLSEPKNQQDVDAEALRDPLYYYFDSVAGNDSNSGDSELQALQSISLLNSIDLLPGDTVYLKNGSVWNSWIQIEDSGSTAQPIVITTYGAGSKPDFRPTAFKKPAITLNGSNIQVNGLLVSDANLSYGVHFGAQSSNNIVEDCEITGTGSGMVCQGSGHIVRGNYIHDLEMIVNTETTINDNDDYGAVGIWFNEPATSIKAYNNRFSNCSASSYDYGTDGGVMETWGSVSNIEFYNNYSENNNGFFEAGSSNAAVITNISIHHNISINDITLFVPHLSGTFTITFSGIKFTNNTIFCDQNFGMAHIDIEGASITGNQLSVVNNIFTTVNHVYDFNFNGFLHEGNLYNTSTVIKTGTLNSNFALGASEEIGDPLFSAYSPATGYTIGTESLAVDKGVSTTFASDYLGNASPVGTTDRGAIEKQ